MTASAPSLTRDLSLIAVGMLIVSIIPLAAELDNLAMLRFTLALGGAVVVPYVISRFVYRDRAISFPGGRTADGGASSGAGSSRCWCSGG